MNCKLVISLSACVALALVATAQAVTIVTVPVGDAGNAADTLTGSPYGAVAYNYNIGKYDVTNSQYCDFLSAKAATSDPYGLWSTGMATAAEGGITRSGDGPYTYSVKPGQGNQPVVEVNWYDTIRFANWLTNGQSGGDTETGSYAITGSGPNWTVAIPDATQRATWATGSTAYWLLPSENEWYKAAYYKGGGTIAGYWKYPTQSDTAPTWELSTPTGPNPGTNSANFCDSTSGFAVTGTPDWQYNPATNYLTDVGAYPDSKGAYGTLDQAGNAAQWNEAVIQSGHGIRGGSWAGYPQYMAPGFRIYQGSTAGTFDVGFRVAFVQGGYQPAPGDANGDGTVDITDLSVVLTNYDKTGLTWSQGDFDGNATVDITDLSKVLTNYNKSFGSAAGIHAVPEPGTFVLLAAGLVGLLAYARRKGEDIMRTCLFVLFATAACSASAGIILNIPSVIVPPSSSPRDLSLDVWFTLTAPTVSQQLLAYDLYLGVTGGDGFSLTGVGTGSDRPSNTVFGDDPYYNVTTGSTGNTLYWFCNLPPMGSYGTIYNGSALLRIKAQLQPGATGTYHIDPYINRDAPPGSATDFESDVDPNAPPYYAVMITDIACPGATVSVALPGDANLDGAVNINDSSAVLTNYDQTGTWARGDFNGDGTVNITDLSNVLTNYDRTAGDSASGAKAVPEPSSLILLGIGMISLMAGYWCRRRT